MPLWRRRLSLAALALSLVPLAGHGAAAQDVVPSSPPELRDFKLKPTPDPDAMLGREPTADPASPPISRPNVAPLVPTESPIVRIAPSRAAPAAEELGPHPRTTRQAAAPGRERETPAAARPPAPAGADGREEPAAAEPTLVPAIETADIPRAPAAEASPEPRAAPGAAAAQGGPPWLGIGLGAAALLAALALLFGLRARQAARRQAEEGAAAARLVAEEARRAHLADAEAARRKREERPWIELTFRPDTAAATAAEAQVHYHLTIRNAGKTPAHNIRIEARMFNIDAEQSAEVSSFFAAPVTRSLMRPGTLPAQRMVEHRGTVTMPREQMRAIMVEGRALFIPLVAFNVLYEYGDGQSGQTALSFVVGREAATPSDRMGPFRLDLGPRIYRSVGQRRNELARVA